ncbi:MAG: STAS domain-containing protein [Prevotellaceae bacterium]|nr:STAS domain-containing protein [Candidatus Faecinaster equi]
MKIDIIDNEDFVLVKMSGRLDTTTSEQVVDEFTEIEKLTSKPITIDCAQLDYIASSGLRLLLRILKAAKSHGNKITLLHLNLGILEILQVTHFDKMFIIKD